MACPSQQATHKYINGHNGKDASECHDTVQYHTLLIQQLKLPANYTPHPIHLGKPPRFSVLHERSSLTHHGLYMIEAALHTMDFTDAATTGIHVLPVKDLREMLKHIRGNTSFHHAPS